MDNKGPLEKFRYEGDALKSPMKVETFKDHKSNAVEFERWPTVSGQPLRCFNVIESSYGILGASWM